MLGACDDPRYTLCMQTQNILSGEEATAHRGKDCNGERHIDAR